MKKPEAINHVLHKRVARYVLVTLLGTLSATSALADETVDDNLIVKGDACIGLACAPGSFPFDVLRIHGNEPRLSMVDQSSDGTPAHDWSMGITDDGTKGPSDFFVRDETYQVEVLRMTADGAVALGAGAALVDKAISVGAMGNERRIVHVADAVNDTDAVNMRQFDQEIGAINDRIDALSARIETLADEVQ